MDVVVSESVENLARISNCHERKCEHRGCSLSDSEMLGP